MKNSKKKETKNINKKTLLLASIGIATLIIAITSLVIFRVAAKEKEVRKAPCYYTIDEVFDYIRDELFTNEDRGLYLLEQQETQDEQLKKSREKQARMGYIITHFYECFDKSNKFLIPTKMKDPFSKPEEFEYISYDEYMEIIKDYEIFMSEHRLEVYGERIYYKTAVDFLYYHAWLKD